MHFTTAISAGILLLSTFAAALEQIDCQGGAVSQDDLAVAQSSLNAWCDAGNLIKPHGHTSATWGNTVAYVCNYNKDPLPCSSRDVDPKFELIGHHCGYPAHGGDYWEGPYTYGYQDASLSICGNM